MDGGRSETLSKVLNLGESLVLRSAPPSTSSLRHDAARFRSIKSTKSQDVPDNNSVLDVSKLREFEGTNFSYLLGHKKPSGKLPRSRSGKERQTRNAKRKRTHEGLSEVDDADKQRRKKRQPVDNATASLYDLVPLPHHHSYTPVAANQCPDLDITRRFPPFSKSPFIPIPPFSRTKVEKYLKDLYARSAWIIPISGKLLWKEASHARLVDNSSTSVLQTGHSAPPESITWTPIVITKFWSDLLEIRKKGNIGAISLSFRVASAEKSQMSGAKTTKSTGQPPAQHNSSTSLEQCTYIKVYHDVRYVMYVRSVLDAWRAEVEVLGTSVASRVTTSPRRTRSAAATSSAPTASKIKVRPLQGAKLVLLDETGQAVGLC